jgi:hypothetical protein
MGAQVSITTQLYLKSRLAAPFHRLKNVVSRTSNLGTIYSSKARVSASGDFFLPLAMTTLPGWQASGLPNPARWLVILQ